MTLPKQTITLDGNLLTYSDVGRADAPPLILIHGWLSYRGVWRQTIEAFKEHYRCVAVDLLGFGDSDKPAEADYSIEAQGRRVLKLADALGIRQFTVIGHSMGGQIALCIASILAPERVTKVVSVSGVVAARLMPFVEKFTYKSVALAKSMPVLYDIMRWLLRYRWVAYSPSGFRTWFYRMDVLPFEDWATDRYMAFQPGIHHAVYWAGEAIHGLNLTAHLPRITSPTLAIFGCQDAVVPVSDGELVKKHVPNGQLALLDQCGHFPMYEMPERYTAILSDFLAA